MYWQSWYSSRSGSSSRSNTKKKAARRLHSGAAETRSTTSDGGERSFAQNERSCGYFLYLHSPHDRS